MQEEIWEIAAGKGKLYLGDDSLKTFCKSLEAFKGQIMVLCDSNTVADCYPILSPLLPDHRLLTVAAGESSKTIQQCGAIWETLTDAAFERGDLMIHLGGGMVCDLGGFAASTYKRGIGFVHVPTSLLAMADAAIGGKTGINFQSFKNQIGTFQHPAAVVIHTPFLDTLPLRERRAGYAEVLKHYLIHDRAAWESAASLAHLPTDWGSIVPNAVKIKLHFTENDPTEKGIRKALNFGHTIGHALESHFLHSRAADALLHGEAVAAGMAAEAFIAYHRQLLSPSAFDDIRHTLYKVYGRIKFEPDEVPAIARWCLQDKKNEGGRVNATLLNGIGDFVTDQWIDLAAIEDSLHAYLHEFQNALPR